MRTHALVYVALVLMLAACAPIAPPVNTQPAMPQTRAGVPSPTVRLVYGPHAPTLPDPKTEPIAALRHSNYPAGLGSVAFSTSFGIAAEPGSNYENMGYGFETARSFGRLNVMDFTAGKIDMEVHVNYVIGNYGQDLHVIRLGERAWARAGGWLWGEMEAAELESDGWVRMGWGGWHPLYMLEPLDSITEAKWVEDGQLDGEPAHHLHVTFDPEKMRRLADATKVRYEYQWVSLLNEEDGRYGDPASIDVQAEVWLDTRELNVRQIEMTIRVVTQEGDDGNDETTWTIARAIKLETDKPNAIAAEAASVTAVRRGMTDCSKVTEIPEGECRALIAFYKATGGSPWVGRGGQGWLAGNRPCTWGGVTCWGGHVRWLILPETGLAGPLPLELSELKRLQVLYMRDNELAGAIPAEIGTLSDLEALDLSWNSGLVGTIPAEIGDLPRLRQIALSLSGLSGPLPETFKKLKLTYLDLSGTGLCVPDDPNFRVWLASIPGLDTGLREESELYCKPGAAAEAIETPAVAERVKALFWERYDVDIAIRQSGDIRVTETQELAFVSGTFSWGQREIALNRLSDITNVAVSEEGGPVYTESGSGEPYTYSVTRDEEFVRVRYNFPPSANSRRTIVIAYTVAGALRYYPDKGVDQLYWKAIPAGNPFQTFNSVITAHVPEPAVFTNYGLYGAESETGFQPDQRDATIRVQGPIAAGQEVEVIAEWQHGVVAGTPQPWQEEIDRGD